MLEAAWLLPIVGFEQLTPALIPRPVTTWQQEGCGLDGRRLCAPMLTRRCFLSAR